MGCDIHLFVERRENGKWITAEKWQMDEECDPPMLKIPYKDRFYTDRNYDLFGMLADVRNGRGFAGCVTGAGFQPICAPRGLPADVCPEVKAEADYWEGDGHSHSWLTLAELKAYDWKGQVTSHMGWVDPLNFAYFERDGKPKSWSGGVSGKGVKHVSNEQMREIIQEHQSTIAPMMEAEFSGLFGWDRLSTYTLVEWKESYYDSAKRFVNKTIPALEAIAQGEPENVRIVFWFDN